MWGSIPCAIWNGQKKFVYNTHLLKNLSKDFILGINFFQDAYDPGNQETYWTDKASSNWKTAELQSPAELTLETISNKIADACEAMAFISRGAYIIQGGPT